MSGNVDVLVRALEAMAFGLPPIVGYEGTALARKALADYRASTRTAIASQPPKLGAVTVEACAREAERVACNGGCDHTGCRIQREIAASIRALAALPALRPASEVARPVAEALVAWVEEDSRAGAVEEFVEAVTVMLEADRRSR